MHQQHTQHRIEVPTRAFADRVAQLGADQSPTGSVYSRLALIHQVAKAYAIEAVAAAGYVAPGLEIDELTDPPLDESTAHADDRVVIHFSHE